jgi:HD-GYP domain-containing protein (c-di-GMP phosphodiesterase class II)
MVSIHRYLQYQLSGLVLLIGLAFTMGGYAFMSRMAEDDAVKSLRSMTGESGYVLDQLLQPPTTLLKLLVNVPDLKTGKEEDWMLRLPAQASILQDNKMLSSVYVAGPQGQFLLLRTLHSDWDRKRFDAPVHAHWLVQLQRLHPSEGEDQVWVILDQRFQILERRRVSSFADYDPRTRPWYQASHEKDGVLRTAAYTFHATGKTGITLAKHMGNGWVMGMDIRVDSLETELTRLAQANAAHIALFEYSGAIVSADRQDASMTEFLKGMVHASAASASQSFDWLFDHKGESWWVGTADIHIENYEGLKLHVAVPKDKLLAKPRQLRNTLLAVTLLITFLTLLITRRTAMRISSVFQTLAERADALIHFDFKAFASTKTIITEIAQLEAGLEQTRTTTSDFLRLLEKVSREADPEKLLPLVLEETTKVAQGESSWLYIYDGSEWQLRAERGTGHQHDWLNTWLAMPQSTRSAMAQSQSATGHYALMLPLQGRRGQLLGLLVIDRQSPFSEQHQNFVETLSGFAALSLESREAIAQQKQLFESFIKLLAEAVDAKSPHTGGHCHRVPVLTEWLVELAATSDAPCVAGFQLNEELREAVHIAAWLHDCGKVVTPEYVVDKATKLETLYDRIHEIRMRFEVCKRETELAAWRSAFPQGLPADASAQVRAALDAIDQDFAFVAESNLGSEYMSPKAIQRLRQIAARTWTRTLDDRLGISREESDRRAMLAPVALPVQEALLSDQPYHKIPRPPGQAFSGDNPWGFRMQVPEYLYDRGELRNLSVERGTLTDEERYKINEHIVLTIKMLEALPFPRHLSKVPEIAGSHHERIDGKGYPRAVAAGSLSIPARMMAIADVFEALTAPDRPYKSGKAIAEALDIMRKMAAGGHLDKDLFEVFAQSGIPSRYAETFLSASSHTGGALQ